MQKTILWLLLVACGSAQAEHHFSLKCDGTRWYALDDASPKSWSEQIRWIYTLYVKSEKEQSTSAPVVTDLGMGIDFGRYYDWNDAVWRQIHDYDEREYTLAYSKTAIDYADETINRSSGEWRAVF
jgi:hypothetical protein